MRLRPFQLAMLAVALIATGCGSLSGQGKASMTLIDIPVHHGGMEDTKTSWYRAYVLKTNSLAPGDSIKVAVRGEVRKGGWVSVPRGTTVLEAIKAAGGFTEFAFCRSVFVAGPKHYYGSVTLHRQRWGILRHSRVWCGNGSGDLVLEPSATIDVARSM